MGVAHNSCANVAQFYFLAIKSPNGLIYVAIYSHLYCIFVPLCGLQKLNCNVSVKGLRRIHDGFATHEMTWQLFCKDFCCKKKVLHVKTFANPL